MGRGLGGWGEALMVSESVVQEAEDRACQPSADTSRR